MNSEFATGSTVTPCDSQEVPKVVALRIDAIKKRMERLGLDAKRLAKLSNVAESTLSRWLSEENSPRLDMLGGLPDALGMDLADLISVDGAALSALMQKRLWDRLSSEQSEGQEEPTAPVDWSEKRLGPGEDVPPPSQSALPDQPPKRRRRRSP